MVPVGVAVCVGAVDAVRERVTDEVGVPAAEDERVDDPVPVAEGVRVEEPVPEDERVPVDVPEGVLGGVREDVGVGGDVAVPLAEAPSERVGVGVRVFEGVLEDVADVVRVLESVPVAVRVPVAVPVPLAVVCPAPGAIRAATARRRAAAVRIVLGMGGGGYCAPRRAGDGVAAARGGEGGCDG